MKSIAMGPPESELGVANYKLATLLSLPLGDEGFFNFNPEQRAEWRIASSHKTQRESAIEKAALFAYIAAPKSALRQLGVEIRMYISGCVGVHAVSAWLNS